MFLVKRLSQIVLKKYKSGNQIFCQMIKQILAVVVRKVFSYEVSPLAPSIISEDFFTIFVIPEVVTGSSAGTKTWTWLGLLLSSALSVDL